MKPNVSTTWLTSSSDSDLDTTIQSILTGLTNNPAFLNPLPTLAAIIALLTAFTTALGVSRNGGKSDTAAKNTARAALATGVRALGQYIDDTAENLEQALSTNYPLKKVGSPLGIQPAPANLRLRHGKVSGTITGVCDSSVHRVLFEWQTAIGDNPTNWAIEPSTNAASTNFNNHPPGSWLNARVRARVPAGAGDWSGVARIMVI
jgi:hypothetical protein